jgi:hypothetical protein
MRTHVSPGHRGRRWIVAAPAFGLLALALLAPPRAGAATCPAVARNNPLASVQRPNQLTVQNRASPCRTITGIVVGDHKEHDGDCHVNLKPVTAGDTAFAALLNAANKGKLITEVLPRYPAGFARPLIPRIGSTVRITGTWVFDKATGWRELHPVWSITVTKVGKSGTGTC